MSLPPIRRQLLVPAGPATAYEVFVEAIGDWWPLADHSVHGAGATVRVDAGRIVETSPDGAEAVWGDILEAEPPHRIRFTWYPGRTADVAGEVAVEFTEVDTGQTLVTLEHQGWERFADPAAARAEYGHGWPRVLEHYRGRLAPEDTPSDPVWLVLIHSPGPAVDAGERVFTHPDFHRHLAFLGALRNEGALVAAGPLADRSGEGMTVVRVADPATAARLVDRAQDEDGSVVAGVLMVRVRPWSVALTGQAL